MQFVGRDDVAALRMFQRLFIEMSANRPELNWLMSHEIGDGSKRLSRLIERVAGKDIDLFIDLIRVAQRLGRYVEGDPAHLHYLSWAPPPSLHGIQRDRADHEPVTIR